MSKIFRRIWHDPVGSKVIAGIILAPLLAVLAAAVHFNWWPRLLDYQIPLWIVIVLIVVGLVIRLVWRRRKKIEIVSVWQSEPVAFQEVICGVTSDPTLPIELRVFAGNVWHKQWDVEFLGHRWRGKCQFGNNPEKSAGQPFTLVAIAPKTRLPDKIPVLPDDALKSEIITVIRSS